MNDPSDSSEPNTSRFRLSIVIALAVVVGLGALLAWWLKPPPEPASPGTAVHAPPDTTAAPAPEKLPAPAPSEPLRRRESRSGSTPEVVATPSEPPKPSATLRVSSDVAGAFVFLDRKFLGKTPLQTSDVEPGAHRLQVSAEGYDGVSQPLEIADGRATDVSVSLKTVVLDARVAVVHKHRFGSCEGSLVADTRGLRYETSDREDVATLPFGEVEKFALDYQGKTLQIKQRGGRTWNFTTQAPNADPLLTFQREVDHARSRLARQHE